MNVVSVRRETAGAGQEGQEPANGSYVLADISYEGVAGAFRYNPFDWTIRDQEGRAYQLGEGNFSGFDETTLDSGTVTAGSKVRGILIIDAPPGALKLEYAVGNSEPAVWDLPA